MKPPLFVPDSVQRIETLAYIQEVLGREKHRADDLHDLAVTLIGEEIRQECAALLQEAA